MWKFLGLCEWLVLDILQGAKQNPRGMVYFEHTCQSKALRLPAWEPCPAELCLLASLIEVP